VGNVCNVTMIVDVTAVSSHVHLVLIFRRIHFKIGILTDAFQFQLEVQTQQVGQISGSLLTI
jgi:hypothetical protein